MTPDPQPTRVEDAALRRLLRRVWKNDVAPLLRGQRAAARARTARVTGTAAYAAGLVADKLLGLKGKPFTRFMTVMGASIGAMLPDVWDWKWFRSATPAQKRVVAEQVRRRSGELSLGEARELLGLAANAPVEDLKRAWRTLSRRYHPDRARSDAQRAEFHVKFIACRAAYERILRTQAGS